jgi:hypothetical protein
VARLQEFLTADYLVLPVLDFELRQEGRRTSDVKRFASILGGVIPGPDDSGWSLFDRSTVFIFR